MSRRAGANLVLLSALAAGIGYAAWPSRAVEQQGVDAKPAPARDLFLGAGSCSAAACHGGAGPRGALLSEHTTWMAHDPHARAYETLWSERSAVIARQLGKNSAAKEALCLKCHVLPDYPHNLGPRFRKEDGVGCESCHGGAGRWLSEHYQDGWRRKTLAQKQEAGMRDTKSLAGRARTCVPCHVGAPGMEVNHDLIAAGHPPLRFEFAAFHTNLPPHWDVKKDRARSADFDARAWALGQVIAAEAACELLAQRAKDVAAPWPEFAEADCYACHRPLPPLSRQRQRANGSLGVLPAGDWYYALLPHLSNDSKEGTRVALGVRDLQGLLSRNYPPREAVAQQAVEASRALRGYLPLLEKQLSHKDFARRLARAVLADGDVSWYRAGQIYLAQAALRRPDASAAVNAQVDEVLESLQGRLRIPERFAPEDIRNDLRNLRDLLAE